MRIYFPFQNSILMPEPNSVLRSFSYRLLWQSVVANFPNHVDKVATTPSSAEHEGDSGTESCPGPAAGSTQRPVPHVVVVLKADSLVPDPVASCTSVIPRADSPRQVAAPKLSLGGIDLEADSPASVPEQSRSVVHPRCVASPAPAVADMGSIEWNFGHPSPASHQQSPVPQPQRPRTRLSERIRKPRVYTDGTIRYGMLTTTGEPSNLDDALSDSNWKQVMDAEFSALMSNKNWHLVPPQKGAKIIGCKWVYKSKKKANGTLDRYKARLVVKWFKQQYRVDYKETFSLIVKAPTIRVILSLAISKGWMIQQLDVHNAFLHGFLEEDVFMHQPPGYEEKSRPHYVCKLDNVLYGLKQAPRAWYARLSTKLLELGFKISKADNSLFYFKNDDVTMFILVYVDDIIITSSKSQVVSSLL
jgi:hypothetical protein